jgi:phospholipid/cholesterol/gamma-HCH transport system permease protein
LLLAAIGRGTRNRVAFALRVLALSFGVLCELPQPLSWRRTVRAEFARILRQAVGGGLVTTIVAAGSIGVAMIYQALFWLGEAGQERLIGSILVTVLVREVAPVLVGMILLGRSGTAAAAEIGMLHAGRQVERLMAQGIDPFLMLVLPRATGLALASYTLGIVFVITALAVGFGAGTLGGGVLMSSWEFSSTVLEAMRPADFIVFPSKMLLIGMFVALTAALTGFDAANSDETTSLLPRTFARGLVAIMLTSVVLSMAI